MLGLQLIIGKLHPCLSSSSFFEELQWKGQYLVIRDGQRHFFPVLLWGNKVPISELMTVFLIKIA